MGWNGAKNQFWAKKNLPLDLPTMMPETPKKMGEWKVIIILYEIGIQLHKNKPNSTSFRYLHYLQEFSTYFNLHSSPHLLDDDHSGLFGFRRFTHSRFSNTNSIKPTTLYQNQHHTDTDTRVLTSLYDCLVSRSLHQLRLHKKACQVSCWMIDRWFLKAETCSSFPFHLEKPGACF